MMNFKGKEIKEVMDTDTIACNGKNLVPTWVESIIGALTYVGAVGDDRVFHDNYYVFIINNKRLKAIFHVYEISYVAINNKRGLLTAEGHETTHQYWFDNGEYSEDHTR